MHLLFRSASRLDKKHTYWKRSLKYLSQFRTSLSHPDNLGKESVLYSFQVFVELQAHFHHVRENLSSRDLVKGL